MKAQVRQVATQALVLPSPSAGRELTRWGLAAAIVCAAHFGLVAGYMLVPKPDTEGAPDSPAVIVELAPMPVAPPSPDDVTPGPEMAEAQPTPKPPEQTEPEVVEPVPKMEAPAEVTLPLPEPKAVETKSDEKPDTQKTEMKEEVQQATPRTTTAPPRSEQRNAPVPRAPSVGSAESRAAIATWRDLVLARLQQNKRYPASAEARQQQGVATLSFTVDRNGRVLSRKIARSSGVAALDDEVLAMVQRAQPLPAFPLAMTQRTASIIVPIRFNVR